MNRTIKSTTYNRIKAFNGLVFIVCGLAVIAQIVHGIGIRVEGVPGYVLGLAFIGLGIVRLRRPRSAPGSK